MANPQTEDGYTRIANEILDHLCQLKLNGTEWMTLLFIIRKTYGFQKKEDKIPLSQISEATGISTSHICRALNKLRKIRIIKRNGHGTGFNKNYDLWILPNQAVPNQAVPNQAYAQSGSSATACLGNLLLPNQADSKETIQKKEYKEIGATAYLGSSTTPTDGIEKAWTAIKLDIERGISKYPNVDLNLEKQKMLNWVAANPSKAKKDWRRFINNWLNKAMVDNVPELTPDQQLVRNYQKRKGGM
jgi:phage replication O-like protein O